MSVETRETAAGGPRILARGPWRADQIVSRWAKEPFEPSPTQSALADQAIARLRAQGSPSHDGLAGRLRHHRTREGRLELDLEPMRWSLRLIRGDAARAIAALCVTRAADGRWLAGRRAAWVASWPGRWTLGAGGSVDLGENPAKTLTRELREEWNVAPERISGEALVELPQRLVMFVGLAWLPEGAEEEVRPDAEHDRFAWWPAEIERWPDEADANIRRMAQMLSRSGHR
jgi:8-oxo-dGTP diphosphatase